MALFRLTFALLELRTDNFPESNNTFRCCDMLGRSSLAQNEQQYNNSTPTTVFHLYPVLSTAVSDFMYPQFQFMYDGQNSWCSHQEIYICWLKSRNGIRNQFYIFHITISGRALRDTIL
jgi:hypothetical protein